MQSAVIITIVLLISQTVFSTPHLVYLSKKNPEEFQDITLDGANYKAHYKCIVQAVLEYIVCFTKSENNYNIKRSMDANEQDYRHGFHACTIDALQNLVPCITEV